MAPEFDHLTDALDDATATICRELLTRLERAPTEKDRLAITTAIAKAAVEGLRRGAKELGAQLDEAIPEGQVVSWNLDLDCTDLWEQRYGEAARPS